MTMIIRSDNPIVSQSEDKLVRAQFAENLAKAILSWDKKESICLAIHGPWGSGKTSIINMCVEKMVEETKTLPEEQKPIVMRFQMWMISEQSYLVKSFLRQLKVTLKQTSLSTLANDVVAKIEKYEKALGYAKLIPGTAEYIEQITELLTGAKGLAETVARKAEDDLDAIKESICVALAELSAPIIIIVDDMDRLPACEIRKLFQLVKAVANFPNTIYMLAYDHSLIKAAIKEFQPDEEGTYLEKIVQLDFEVPRPSPNKVKSYLLKGLKNILDESVLEGLELSRWNDLWYGYLPSLFTNLREVKRYLNMVYFRYPLTKGEVSSIDLLILEAIRMFAVDVYKEIKSKKDFLVSDSMLVILDRHVARDEKKKWIQHLPELAPENRREDIIGLLCCLFPEIYSVFRNSGWGDGYRQRWNEAQRVCISPYYDYYFDTILPESEVAAQEVINITKLFTDQKSLTEALSPYVQDGRIGNLLGKIESHLAKNTSQDNIETFISSLADAVENMEPRHKGMNELPLSWALSGTSYRLLRLLDSGVRKQSLIDAFDDTKKAIWLPIELIDLVWRETQEESKSEESANKERLFNAEEVDALEEYALKLIRKYRDSDKLLDSYGLYNILYAWERWKNGEPKVWVQQILAKKENVSKLLLRSGGFITRESMNSSYATSQFVIKPSNLEWLCDVQALKAECEALLANPPEWAGEDECTIFTRFIDGFKRQWHD